jgi:hypothetical protein
MPASHIALTASSARTRIISCPAKRDLANRFEHETGHNWHGFASNEAVRAAIFKHGGYRNNTVAGRMTGNAAPAG